LGVASSRIHWLALNWRKEDYLVECGIVDLYLDTFEYNGGSTSVDLLFMGVPVLTKKGTDWISRMGYSLLRSIGLEDSSPFIASSVEEYERFAIDFALSSPFPYSALSSDLTLFSEASLKPRDKEIALLFDTKNFARHLEIGFSKAWRRLLRNLQPDSIKVSSLSSTNRSIDKSSSVAPSVQKKPITLSSVDNSQTSILCWDI